MKAIHWGCILLVLIAYAVGASFPGPFNTAKAAVGL
jgi:hypothetical protein